MKNIIYTNRNLWLIIVLILIQTGTWAQKYPPYTFDTPEYTEVYRHNDTEAFEFASVLASDFDALPKDSDSFMVKFDVNLDLNTDGVDLLEFQNGSNAVINITYRDHTINVRRYYKESGSYFDYILFDPLFMTEDSSTEATWEFKAYISSTFMWFQASVAGVVKKIYLAPVYMGLNYPDYDNMTPFMGHKTYGRIIVGDEFANNTFDKLTIQAYKLSDLYSAVDKFAKTGNPVPQ